MSAYSSETGEGVGRSQKIAAFTFLVLAVTATYLPPGAQQPLASALRATVLRPFIATQESLAEARLRASRIQEIRAQMDSLVALTATQSALVDENRSLRGLLGLGERLGPAFRPASVIRPGTPGSESMFLLLLGARDGVRVGAPVLNRHGLVGVIREVRARTSVGMDWTHPDFRASAMLEDGTAYAIVENRRGAFREADRLLLNGAAYHEDIAPGTVVLTSGLGGVFPRGIPIGRVVGLAEADNEWRKSYWLQPFVEPGAATHVLVAVGEREPDLTAAWPADSILPATVPTGTAPGPDSVARSPGTPGGRNGSAR